MRETTMKLSEQKCVPCEGGTLPMASEEVQKHLGELKEWVLVDNKIEKAFEFSNFIKAIEFVNVVADLAESEGHHPDIHISYNKVRLTLWTHAIGGLSINDFILASKIDKK